MLKQKLERFQCGKEQESILLYLAKTQDTCVLVLRLLSYCNKW
jgi:hypothetical protein